jgi:hypothetical protein
MTGALHCSRLFTNWRLSAYFSDLCYGNLVKTALTPQGCDMQAYEDTNV